MNKKENTLSSETMVNKIAVATVWVAFLKEAFTEKSHIILTTIGVALGLILFLLCRVNLKIPTKTYFIWWIIIISGMINVIFVGSMKITNFIPMVFLYFPIAVYFYYWKIKDNKWWEFNYYIYALYLIFRMITSPDGYLLFYSTSRNMLSSLLLIWLTILYFVFYNANKEIPLRCIIIFFVGCFIANGRGGIISALILLAFYCLYITFSHLMYHRARWIPWTILLYFLVCYTFLHSHDLFEKYLYRFTDFQSIRSSEARIDAWRLYIKSIFENPFYLIFGGNAKTIFSGSYLYALNGNLHNSFLSLHSRLGCVAFISICWQLCSALKKSITNRKYTLFILIIVCLIRSMTDTLFPGKIADIFLWLFIFYSISSDEYDSSI